MQNRTNQTPSQSTQSWMDPESANCLTQIAEEKQVIENRADAVKFVVVVLSAKGMVFDLGALRQKVVLAYPDAAVFFLNTTGKPMTLAPPEKIDLLIDFTGPGQRQGLFFARKMRRLARVAVGRNAGLFRKRLYDRVFDEVADSAVPRELLERERFVQKKVLNLAGVSFVQSGETPPDRGKTIALELPGMLRL